MCLHCRCPWYRSFLVLNTLLQPDFVKLHLVWTVLPYASLFFFSHHFAIHVLLTNLQRRHELLCPIKTHHRHICRDPFHSMHGHIWPESPTHTRQGRTQIVIVSGQCTRSRHWLVGSSQLFGLTFHRHTIQEHPMWTKSITTNSS